MAVGANIIAGRIDPNQSCTWVFLLSNCLMHSREQARAMRTLGPSGAEFGVIVVDDDLAVRTSLKFLLESEGFTVRSYATGAALLGAGELTSCGCLVVDQQMPGISGLDLIDLLRSRHYSGPAILITSDPNLSVRARAKKASVPIVEKPLLGNALLQKIRDVADRGS
jgi:FixJ family two-component response regulator